MTSDSPFMSGFWIGDRVADPACAPELDDIEARNSLVRFVDTERSTGSGSGGSPRNMNGGHGPIGEETS